MKSSEFCPALEENSPASANLFGRVSGITKDNRRGLRCGLFATKLTVHVLVKEQALREVSSAKLTKMLHILTKILSLLKKLIAKECAKGRGTLSELDTGIVTP